MHWQHFLKTIVIGSLLISSPNVFACTCENGGDFNKYSKGSNVVEAIIVSYGEKLSHGEQLYAAMTIRIDKVITGKLQHKMVILRGDPGDECLTYINAKLYPIGSRHLIALFDNTKKQDLLGCGEVSVRVLGNTVRGVRYNDGKVVGYSHYYKSFIKALRGAPAG